MDKLAILVNSIRTPDGTVLTSYDRHDYVAHTDTLTGEFYMTDGGIDYMRRSINVVPAEDLSVYSDASHDIARQAVTWGTRGKDGLQPFKRIAVKDMETSHIEAVLYTQFRIYPQVKAVMINELKHRGVEYEES